MSLKIPFQVGGLYVLKEHLPVSYKSLHRATDRILESLLQYTKYDERFHELVFMIVAAPQPIKVTSLTQIYYSVVSDTTVYYRFPFPFSKDIYSQLVSGIVPFECAEDIVLYVGSPYLSPCFSSIVTQALSKVTI
jgi:hypothetical protein